VPAASFADVVDPVDPYSPGPGAARTAARVETGIFGTIAESIFGHTDPDSWRPLPFSTLFSEG
jgi:hypothetical protein